MNNGDDLGNWLTSVDRGGSAINRTFDKANRMNDWGIVNTATLHNAAGNQRTMGTFIFSTKDECPLCPPPAGIDSNKTACA